MRLALFLLPLALSAQQLTITVSPMSPAAAKHLLNSRIAKLVTPCLVAVNNQTDAAVSVSEAAVLRLLAPVGPFDHASMSLLIDEAARNSGWARAGRSGKDVITAASFLAASKNVKWGPPIPLILTGVLTLTPAAIDRLKGAEAPIRQNFESLSWSSPITLQPGDSGTGHVFTAPWPANSPALTFDVDTSKIRAVKVLQ